MSLTQYTPHLVTAFSLFLAIFLHWKIGRVVWKPSFLSGFCTAIFALLMIFVLQDNYLNIDLATVTTKDWVLAGFAVMGLAFFYGLIIALLIGYVLKIAPSFFD